MRNILGLLVGSFLLGSPAVATEAEPFVCTPDNFQAELAVYHDGAGQLRIWGTMDVPNPGYVYELTSTGGADKRENFDLSLTAPEGAVIQVIGTLDIDEEFVVPPGTAYVDITINKPFNWGAESINCTILHETVKED